MRIVYKGVMKCRIVGKCHEMVKYHEVVKCHAVVCDPLNSKSGRSNVTEEILADGAIYKRTKR
jgi:hypothetical protein